VTAGPTVSILVTTYNRERFLPACLDSIIASDYADFEVIVVDDGSTDATLAIARDYETSDSRVRCFRNDRNLGDYPNRMRAAGLASGRYLKYVDSDDLIYRHGLNAMVDAMETHSDAALGISHSLPEDEQPYPWKLQPAETWRKEFLGSGCLGSGPTGAIIRRDAFANVGGFRDWGVLNDTDLWFRLSAKYPVVLLPPGLVWWRRHEDQEFTKDDAKIEYLERGFALEIDALSSSECPLPPAERRMAIDRSRQRHARRLLSLALKQGRAIDAMRIARRAGLSAGDMLRGFAPYR
jgi:glycosyltransferase involved in cell wall biosynthesis